MCGTRPCPRAALPGGGGAGGHPGRLPHPASSLLVQPARRPGSTAEDAMSWIALKMLMGDPSKYVVLVFGVTFACFLIAEQSATFCGVMLRTTSLDFHGGRKGPR